MAYRTPTIFVTNCPRRLAALTHNAVVGQEGQEGSLIGQDVSAHLLSHNQASAHAGVGRDVPLGVGSEGLSLNSDAQILGPQGDFLGVSAGVIATGNEDVLALSDGSEGFLNGSSGSSAGGVMF